MQTYRRRPLVAAAALAIVTCLAVAPASSLAQQPNPTPIAATDPAKDPFRAKLLPPDIVMRLGHKAGVTTDQRKAIITLVSKRQSAMLETSLEMETNAGELLAALDETPVDEARAKAAFAKVLATEMNVKKAHFDLLINIRNLLTAEQMEQLQALRDK
jgi:Spy/CpxP family protein refolding chaperone